VALYDDPASKINTTVRIGKSILGTKRDEETIAKAQPYFQAAINLAQQQADKKIAATAYMEIGVAYRLPSRLKATDYFQKALTIYQAEGDLYGQAMALYRLSSVSSATKSLELAGQALPIFDRVLPTLQASDKQVELAEAYSAMGFLYRRKKEFPASLDSFNRALAIYQRLQRLSDQKSRIRNVENLIRTTQRLKDGTN
jgi:tetratricopeptide (TPR) repeat protein